jgi:hypothetical protein
MAPSHQTGNPIVTTNNPLADLLAAPLGPNWTVEELAEQVLSAIAAQGAEEAQPFVLDADAATDRQARRLLRPLLACLATKSAAEAGTPANLYGGQFALQRPGPQGPVWILGQFENRPGSVCVTLRRSDSRPQGVEARSGLSAALLDAASPGDSSPPKPGHAPTDDRLAATPSPDGSTYTE